MIAKPQSITIASFPRTMRIAISTTRLITKAPQNTSASFPTMNSEPPRATRSHKLLRRSAKGCSAVLGALGGSTAGGGGAAEGLGGLSGIAKMLGLGSTDPRQMDDDDAAKVMNYARKERPEVLRQTVEEKPWFVKAMGNPIVMGVLTMAAAKLLRNRQR
jgi:hypothetical protein